jgi:hypothetical protein
VSPRTECCFMLGNWREDHLPNLVAALLTRPGHDNVRTLIGEMLHHAFGADYLAIDQEVRLPEVHGRADTLFGSVVFEFKSNLQRELGDVLARLPDYLVDRERQTGRRFVGIAADGAEFIAYEVRDRAPSRLAGTCRTGPIQRRCSPGWSPHSPTATISPRIP